MTTEKAEQPEKPEPRKRFSIREIAEVAHNAHEAYSAMIGESSGARFHELAEAEQQGVMEAVQSVLGDAGVSNYEIHENWRARKTAAGWVFGEERHGAAKVHPNLRRFNELEPEQALKTELFVKVIRTLAKKLGL